MNTSRRDFLKQGAALAATLSFGSSLLAKAPGTQLTGMQLYCVAIR